MIMIYQLTDTLISRRSCRVSWSGERKYTNIGGEMTAVTDIYDYLKTRQDQTKANII